jgi:hypothetical protein
MFNLNRRHTEAVEKSARAEKRLADAEETIARHLGDFLRDTDVVGESKPAPQAKRATPPKNKPPRK